jgi:hypothetical protein
VVPALAEQSLGSHKALARISAFRPKPKRAQDTKHQILSTIPADTMGDRGQHKKKQTYG